MKKRTYMAAGVMAVLLSVPAIHASAMEESEVVKLAEEIGEQYGICPEFLQAIARRESRYDELAEAGGCVGLMQVAEQWHMDRMERLQVEDLYDPAGNMLVAADYLSELFGKYEDIGMVLMVYSGDSGAEEYAATGKGLSEYAEEILALTEKLERQHGK